jgi:hypothetical protein
MAIMEEEPDVPGSDFFQTVQRVLGLSSIPERTMKITVPVLDLTTATPAIQVISRPFVLKTSCSTKTICAWLRIEAENVALEGFEIEGGLQLSQATFCRLTRCHIHDAPSQLVDY